MPFGIPGFTRYSYNVEASSLPDHNSFSTNERTSDGDKSSRPSEERKSISSVTDRNYDRFRNASFKYPEDFNPKTHIRLLHILFSTKYEVVARFKSVAIKDLATTSYSALSYTWGTANTEQDIHQMTVCGQTFHVRDNLWKFFTQTQQAWEGRLLYIDAICIDQRNTAERSEQVKLMPEIYSHANKVCAWLGAPYHDEHRRELAAFSERLAQDKLGRSWNPDALFGLAHLCSRTYWTRLWAVQELLLAGNVTILYGKMRFEWDDVARLQRRVDEADSGTDQALSWWSAWVFNPPKESVHQNHADEHIEHGWQSGWRVIHHRTLWNDASNGIPETQDATLYHAARNGFPLYQAVNYFSGQQCQDSRDKIYALLGLLEPFERNAIEPNYENSAAQVYGRALKVGLCALQRDVEPAALANGQYPDDQYHGFALDLCRILRLKQKDVEAFTTDAFKCPEFRAAFVRNCQREHGLNWSANNVKSLAEVESNIIHGFLELTEHEQSSRKAFGLLVDIKGKMHVTSSALAAARSGLFDKNKFAQVMGKQSVGYRATFAVAEMWTRATRWRRWRPFRG